MYFVFKTKRYTVLILQASRFKLFSILSIANVSSLRIIIITRRAATFVKIGRDQYTRRDHQLVCKYDLYVGKIMECLTNGGEIDKKMDSSVGGVR